jgi:tetratricopeptide (TPR) repeat protein/transcriptional regulator with XRE-family HTH domain
VSDQDFAADLRSLCIAGGLSLRELVRSTGIPRSTLSDAMAGRRMPRLETVLAIVRACGADLEPWRRRWVAANRQLRLVNAAAATFTPEGPEASIPAEDPVPPAVSARPDSAAAPQSPAASAQVPAQLPHDIGGFASREHELATLRHGGVSVIHGRPGVGKTALAVHWAHAVQEQYPDGQLFLNMRGHHPTLGPVPPVEAMGRLLGSIGVPWAPLTQDPDDGAGLWRSALFGRRLLIVLDDAISAEQVRPLMPGAPGCTMVVTSRHYLAGLIVLDGADGILLDVLPPRSSVALLGHVVGAARVEAEPAAAAAVAEACGHLPLALRLAGAVLAGAPERAFADLVDAFATGDRLAALEGLARPSVVEDAFELSYRALPEDARLLFRRLGLHPGPDISSRVAGLLADLDLDTAGGLLRALAEAHLVEPVRSGRYRMHDLLRVYASRLAQSSDAEADRDAVRRRLFDWYTDRALAVSARLDKGRERVWVDDALRSSWEPGDDEAAGWLDAEHRNIAAVIEYDAWRGSGEYAWALVDLTTHVLARRTDVTGLIAAIDAGLDAARRHADPRAEAAMRLRRGWLMWRNGQGEGVVEDFARARPLFRSTGVRRPEAAALCGLSASYADSGRLKEARDCAEEALEIYRSEGDRNGEARTLNSLGVGASRAADLAAAASYFEESLVLHRAAGDRGYVAMVLTNLADVHLARGGIAGALDCTEEAVAVAREAGDGVSESLGLAKCASALEHAGLFGDAYHRATLALTRAREMGLGHRFVEAVALDALATTARRLGHADARDRHADAMRAVREVGDLYTEARILVGATRDLYQDAVELADGSVSAGNEAFGAAHDAAQRTLDAGLASGGPYVQAEALVLIAACDLSLGKVADALDEARRAVAMHVTSGARLAEITARWVLAYALARSGDPAEAKAERRAAQKVLDELALPGPAPARRLLDHSPDTAFPHLA